MLDINFHKSRDGLYRVRITRYVHKDNAYLLPEEKQVCLKAHSLDEMMVLIRTAIKQRDGK